MRLIVADKLKQRFNAARANDIDVYGSDSPECFDAERANYIVNSMPTIEAEPVRYGRWIHTITEDDDWGGTFHKWSCSVCNFHTGHNQALANYCPNCGAKMDLEG